MKKNLMLGALVAAVAVTSYSVSGTYAKYVSSIDLTDEARVASWGFSTVDRTNCTKDPNNADRWICQNEATKLNLFADSYTYNNDTKTYVKSLDGDKVVAPGTTGEYKIGFKGAMEVMYKLDLEFGIDQGKEVAVSFDVAENGDLTIYDDVTTGAYVYSPITYTVNLFWGDTPLLYKEGKLAEVSKALADWSNSGNNVFEPGRLGQAFDISWKWNKENDGYEYATGKTLTLKQADELDTYIGKNWSKWYPDVDHKGGSNDLGNESTYRLKATATQVAENYSKKSN